MAKRLIFDDEGLTGSVPEGFKGFGMVNGTPHILKPNGDIEQIGGSSTNELRYIAALSQSGAHAPVATVIRNDFDGDVVWSKSEFGDGSYTGTLVGAFSGHVRIIPPSNISSAFNITREGYGAGSDNDDTVYLLTHSINNSTGEATPSDGLLYGEGYSYIEIIKYV